MTAPFDSRLTGPDRHGVGDDETQHGSNGANRILVPYPPQMDAGQGQTIPLKEHLAHRERCGAREQHYKSRIVTLEKEMKTKEDIHARQLKDIKQNYNKEPHIIKLAVSTS
jgi:hypothetical protein